MSAVKKIVDGVKRHRECEEAIDRIQRRSERRFFQAILALGMALLFAWQAYRHGISTKIEEKRVLLEGAIDALLAVVMFMNGLVQLMSNPDDRLLLVLAEQALAKESEPNTPNSQ